MTNLTLWQRISQKFYQLAAVFAELAIGIPGIVIVFVNGLDNRWVVLALTVVFLGLSIGYTRVRHEQAGQLIVPYLVVQTFITVVLVYLNPNLTFYIIWFYVLSIEAFMALPRRQGLAWLLAFICLTAVLLVLLLPFLEAMITLPIYLGGFFFFYTFANATYQANTARKQSQRLLEELQVAHQQLKDYAVKAEELAVAEERNRLSREMHDTIGHRLTAALVQLEGMQKLAVKDPVRAEAMAGVVREEVRAALQELRQTVATLRQPLEADLPLDISLNRLVHSFEKATGLLIHLMLPDRFPDLSPAHRVAIYRTAQEALTNIQKHAGATQVWLQVDRQEGLIVLRVSDNGKGLRDGDLQAGFGLRGMRERAAQLGGDFRLEARLGGGAQLLLNLPVEA